jgi:hypothetical protein
VRQAGALPPTPVMEAWATVAAEVGLLVGQAGLALSLPQDRRAGMAQNLQARARLLDEATGSRLGAAAWVEHVAPT